MKNVKWLLGILLPIILLGCAMPKEKHNCIQNTSVLSAKYDNKNDTLTYSINTELTNYCYDFVIEKEMQVIDATLVIHAKINFFYGICAQGSKYVKLTKSLENFNKKYDKVKYVKLYVKNVRAQTVSCYMADIQLF